jgi:DNA polymerase-3 subunit gamma/tau
VTEPDLPPWLDDGPPPEDDNAAAAAAAAQAPATPPAVPVVLARVALQATVLGARWAALLQPLLQAGKLAALVRELAMQAEWVAEQASAQGPTWQLRVERESLRSPALRDKLAAALAEAGHAATLELLPGVAQDSLALREAQARQQRQQAAEAAVQADPRVQALLQQYRGARIVPGSIQPHTPQTPPPRSDTP